MRCLNFSFLAKGGAVALLFAPALAPAAAVKPPQFVQCAVCHSTTPDGRSGMGPGLWKIGSRPVGSVPGFSYSPAMKKAGGTWDRARLIAYVSNPRKALPGTRMVYAGQRDPKVAAAIADYILSLK